MQSNREFKDYFRKGKFLASGSIGEVCECKRRSEDRKSYVVKIVKSAHYQSVQNEIRALELCRGCPSIVQLVDYFGSPNARKNYLVYEKANETLYKRALLLSCFDECSVSAITRQLARALDYLHGQGIAHRDVKLSNVLCFHNGEFFTVKLTDFDTATTQQFDDFYHRHIICSPKLKDLVGTHAYLAPEIVARRLRITPEPYTTKCDIWSLGMIVYRLLYGEYAPHCRRIHDFGLLVCHVCLARKMRCSTDHIYHKHKQISAEAKRLIRSLFAFEPVRRASAGEVLRSPWIEKYLFEVPKLTRPSVFQKLRSSLPRCSLE